MTVLILYVIAGVVLGGIWAWKTDWHTRNNIPFVVLDIPTRPRPRTQLSWNEMTWVERIIGVLYGIGLIIIAFMASTHML